ncbi:MAG: hypothetical protein N4A48_02720 [Tepidibacter sp.]|uniref:hypothetical protein n=1 Tax=Tepidibacter sp. TaxID=2529387 RepID=UPI0025D97B26|nr:hypothetical protein [Tepidibacter sp.]MCT4507669.1 hypothetical protein [Tepidibacter sp.]
MQLEFGHVIDKTKEQRVRLDEILKSLFNYENNDETVIYIPKQLVIFIEQNRNIKHELKMKLVFPDGQEVKLV